MLVLGLDVGTQGTKALVVDSDEQRVVARAAVTYGLLPGLPPGHAEQHPHTWWQAVRDVVAQLGRDLELSSVRAIGVSGQQHGFVPLDAAGEVIRPAKLWCDTATSAEAAQLSSALGRHVPAGFTASKILWLARHEPEHFARLSSVLLPHDWINFRLTGERAMEAGDASGTGFFDPRERRFDQAAMVAIDPVLPELVPGLVEPGAALGELDASAAKELGLTPGILVAAGAGDNMASAMGSGATRPGVFVCSLGTSATVFTYASTACVDPEGLIAPFCDSTGGWLPLLCVMNATGVLEEVRAAFGASLEQLTRAAREVEAGCGGVLFVPYLGGERVPDLPDATGSLLGLTQGSLRAGVVFRAALEGIALNLAWGVDRMRALGLTVDAVRLVGGGARNELWRSILADALDAPVVGLEEQESAALGAALQALWTLRRSRGEELGAHEVAAPFVRESGQPVVPDAARVATYRELGARFRAAAPGVSSY